uniref:Cytochrome C n=1 Tax=Meloidogyne hapla TaxID=6305 RepID=A0A1I8C3B0_MELHA
MLFELKAHINTPTHQFKTGKDVNLKMLRVATDEEKWNNFISKEEKKYFKVDKDGINCLLCHEPEKRVI